MRGVDKDTEYRFESFKNKCIIMSCIIEAITDWQLHGINLNALAIQKLVGVAGKEKGGSMTKHKLYDNI